MGRRELVELTTLCLVRQGRNILMQNRVKKDWQGYTLPGGHVEQNESVVDACIREMKEETGLDVSELRLRGVKQFPIAGGRYLVFLFEALHFSGELQSSREGEMEWVPFDELSAYQTVEDLQELLDVMLCENLNEFQYTIENGRWLVNLR